jgi:hypothetical protein
LQVTGFETGLHHCGEILLSCQSRLPVVQTHENETVRVIFVGWLLVFDHAVGATDRIRDRVSSHVAQSPSSKTCDWRILLDQI